MVATKHIRSTPPASHAGERNAAGTGDTYAIERLLRQAADFGLRAPELTLVLGERSASLAEAAGSNALWVHAEGLVVSARVRLGLRSDSVARAVAVLRAAEDLGETELVARLRTDIAVCARSVGAPLTGLAALRPVLGAEGVTGAAKAAALCQLVGCLSQFGRKPELDRTFVEADKLCGADDSLDGDSRLLARAFLRVGMAAHRRRHADILGAADAARTGLGLLEQLDDPGSDGGVVRVRLILHLVCSLLDRGDFENAHEIAQPFLDEPARAGAIAPLGWLRMAVATRILLPSGSVEAAAMLLRDGVHSAERHGLHALTSRLWAELSNVEQALGRPAEAMECLHQTRAAEHVYSRSRRQAVGLLTGEFGNGGHAAVDLDDVLGGAPDAEPVRAARHGDKQARSSGVRLAPVRAVVSASATPETPSAHFVDVGASAERTLELAAVGGVERSTGVSRPGPEATHVLAPDGQSVPGRRRAQDHQNEPAAPELPLAPAPADEPAPRFSLVFEPKPAQADAGKRAARDPGNQTVVRSTEEPLGVGSSHAAGTSSKDGTKQGITDNPPEAGAVRSAPDHSANGHAHHRKDGGTAPERRAEGGSAERRVEQQASGGHAADRVERWAGASSDGRAGQQAGGSSAEDRIARRADDRSAEGHAGRQVSGSSAEVRPEKQVSGGSAEARGERPASDDSPKRKTRHDSEHGSVAARSVLDRLGISTGAGGGRRRRAADVEPGQSALSASGPDREMASGRARIAENTPADGKPGRRAAVSDAESKPRIVGTDAARVTSTDPAGMAVSAHATAGAETSDGSSVEVGSAGPTRARTDVESRPEPAQARVGGAHSESSHARTDKDSATDAARGVDAAVDTARNAAGTRGDGVAAAGHNADAAADRAATAGDNAGTTGDIPGAAGTGRDRPDGADSVDTAGDRAGTAGDRADSARDRPDGGESEKSSSTGEADEGYGIKVDESWMPRLRLPPSLEPFDDFIEDVPASASETHFTSTPNIEDDGLEPFRADHSNSSFLDDELPEDAGLADLLARALAEHRAGTSSAAALVKRLGNGSDTEPPVNGHSRNGEVPGNGRHRTEG